MGVLSFDEFKKQRAQGGSVSQIVERSKAAGPSVAGGGSGPLTFEQFQQARNAGMSIPELVSQGKGAGIYTQQPAGNAGDPNIRTWAGRDALLKELNDIDTYSGWITDEMQANEAGNVYVTPWEARQQRQQEQAAAKTPTQNPEDLSIAQRAIDRILGDRTQITGEKTDWRKLLKGIWYKGADQFSTGVANTLDFLAGDFAEELHVLGVESVNQAIEALNYIPGVDLDYVENKGNFLSRWASWLRKGQQQNQEYFAANANSSRAAQIVDKFGTSTVAAIPMALEALMLGPAAAAQGAGTTATTAGLQYTSSLAQSSGLSAMSQMGMQGMRNLMKDPQFWTSYLQVMGDGYQDALDQGMSDSDAALYGMVNGFFNAVIEIGGGDESLGGINRLPAQLREALESGNMGVVVSIAKSMFGEGWEEVQQGIMERGLMQAAQGDSVGEMFSLDPTDTRAAFNPFSAADEFAGGAVVGGLLGGGQSAITSGINRVAGRAAHQQEQTATQQQPMPTAQETGTQYVQQVINNMDVPEAAQRILMDGLEIGNADPQTYAQGIQEAFRLGEMGLNYEQAVENSTQSDNLTREQFQHAWQIGAQKSGNAAAIETPTVSRRGVPEYDSIESFSREFTSPEKVTEIFDQTPDADVNEFAAGFRAAYDMGQSGVSANYLTEANVPALSTQQAQAAYQLGQTDAEAAAVTRDTATAQKQKSDGNQARVRGTVRGEGVTISDLRRSFNDSQNTAYRLLTRYADTTGVNIVLYNSQADSNGMFPAAQGRFQWKDDTIYIDINSGLNGIGDVNELGNYTMLRTFAHEFTHFIEKWNAAEYNEFRQFVFETLEAKGENVHDLIESMQARDESGNMTYEEASREVVADAMTDVLEDSQLVQRLANEKPTVFQRLLRKLRQFAARVKQAYRNMTSASTREAQALKENGKYLDGIVKMWDDIAAEAVKNYQGAKGETVTQQAADKVTSKKEKPSKGQESLMRQPFEKQAEFDQKRARYNEVMEGLNPKEEQAIAAEGDEDTVESSTRQQSLSNTEILEMAADQLNTDKLSDAEKNALSIFQKRLDALNEAQAQRAALGQQYREQQFQKGGSRAEAEKIRNRMQVMDGRIQRLQNEVVSLENKDVLRNVLNQARSVVEGQERAKGASALKKYRERRNESQTVQKYRARVRAQVLEFSQLMTRPSNKDIKKHVPAEIQKTLVDFLDGINLSSKTALASSGLSTTKADQQYLKSMRRLHDAIKENVDARGLYSGYAELPPDFLDNFSAMIRKVEDMVESSRGEFVINEMSAAQLKELSQTLRTLKKYIVNMNKLHNNAVFAHADEAGENTVRHLMPLAASKKSGEIYKFIRFGYMRPSYAFDHFGEGGKSIEREFRDGQATQAFLARRVIDFAEKTYSGKEVDAWGKDIKTVKLSGGEEISLPVTHIMSLYCLNKRAQAQTHIYGDGIRVANYKAGGKVQLDEGHLVTQEDVDKLVQQLTPHQIKVADALQNFMSTECAKWGNHVSMARFDVEQFTDPNYFPINSDGRYLPATADESPDNAGLYALLNMGFTKELKENAKNRIILYNVFDVFANHTASMTQYRSFALPVLDALKWFNYQNGDTSVRDQLSKAFGAPEDTRAGSGSKGYAEEFVLNLIRAYNGTSANGDAYDTSWLRILHRYNGAAIAYNLRVIIQQPTAITRAAMILSPAKLTKGLVMRTVQLRKLAEEMEAHSGIAVWKGLGFYDTNISRGLTDKIKQNPTLLDDVMEVGTKGAEAADRFTWAAMWYAAKDSVKRSAYDTEEAYFKAVTDLFEEVIYKTQVVDSVLTKSEFLRSKGGIARQLGSFMSEPSATVSMLMDAAYKYSDDIQRGMSRSEAWKRNGGNIAKTAGVYAVGQVILAAMQSVIDAWRDDDEYDENWLKNFFQKYVNAFKRNVIEELLPFGKIPVLSEIYETIKSWVDYAGLFEKWNLDLYGNDVSSGLSMYLKYVNKTMQIGIDKLMGNKTNYTNYGAVYNLMRAVSNLSGIPVATAWREVQDAWNNTVGFFAPRMKLVTYERAIDRKYNELVRPTGVSQKQYEKYLSDADTSGNGSVTQDELGEELSRAVKAGDLTSAQAEAIWKTKWNGANSKTFSDWKSGGKKTTAPVSSTTASTAKPAKVSTYDDFKSATKLYDKESVYNGYKSNLSPIGVSLDDFTKFINAANTDGNSSIKQAELGEKLYDAVQRGDMTEEEANAWFRVFWNEPGSKTYTKWAARNKK